MHQQGLKDVAGTWHELSQRSQTISESLVYPEQRASPSWLHQIGHIFMASLLLEYRIPAAATPYIKNRLTHYPAANTLST